MKRKAKPQSKKVGKSSHSRRKVKHPRKVRAKPLQVVPELISEAMVTEIEASVPTQSLEDPVSASPDDLGEREAS